MEYLVRLIGRRLERKDRISVSRGGSRVWGLVGVGDGDGVWIGMVWNGMDRYGMVFFAPGRVKVYQT